MQAQHDSTLINPAEAVTFYVCLVVLALFGLLTLLWQQPVAWGEVAFRSGAALGVGLLGLLYRKLGRSEGIALALIGTGLFVGFSNSMILLNYLFFPVSRPVIDPLLIQMDGYVGYHWQSFVILLAAYPLLGSALAWVYHSSIVQMFGMIIFLGFSVRHLQLYRFIFTGMLAGLMTVGFWILFPSFGPTAYQSVPPDAAAKINLVVTNDYGTELLRMARDGNPVISISNVLGVIAFPSFHTVMAGIAVWYSRGTILFYPLLILNTFMLPAILSHGGHHFVDVIGGLLVCAVSIALTQKWLLPGSEQYPQNVPRIQK